MKASNRCSRTLVILATCALPAAAQTAAGEDAARNAAPKGPNRKQPQPAPKLKAVELKRIAPGVLELTMKRHDFALVAVE